MSSSSISKKSDQFRRTDEFVEVLRRLLPELRERYGVRSLGLFGSYVRGEAKADSDLDVLVEFDRVPTLFRLVELQDYLAERLGVEVDLVPRDSLRPAVAERILPEIIPIR